MGYSRAGFEVVGVDIAPQPRYPFEFHQGDALEFIAAHGHEYDFIAASPPCQHYANVTKWRGNQDDHPDLIGFTRDLLMASGKPYVIENVKTTELRAPFVLCGSMFGLNVQRHRYFESNVVKPVLVPACNHHSKILPFMHKGERAYADAMGCDWMTAVEARQAIPPAYTEWIGAQLLALLEVA